MIILWKDWSVLLTIEVKNEKAMKEKKDNQGEGKNELGNSGNAFVFLQENNHNQLLVKKGQSSSNMEDSNSLNSRKGGGSSKSQPSGGGSKGGSGGGGKKSGDGDTIAILPGFDPKPAIGHADIIIPTGLDLLRNGIVAVR